MKKIISYLIIGLIFFKAYPQKNCSAITLHNVDNIAFLMNDSINQNCLILYYGEPICTECIEHLIIFFNTNKIPYYLIIEDRNDILYRKKKMYDFSLKSNSYIAIYFDKAQNKNSIKSIFKLNRDFPIIIFYDKKIKIFSTKEIFTNNANIELTQEIKSNLMKMRTIQRF